jgi:hypothetical protein
VTDRDEFELPVYGQETSEEAEEDAASCSPKAFVSNEESAIAKAMQELREDALVVRQKLEENGASDDRTELENQLADLRGQWKQLSKDREKAYCRKMVMLGHLPPEALIE